MAHFYGVLQGSRGEATRCGTKASGMRTHAASWEGQVKVVMYYHEREERDYVRVSLARWHGGGVERELYHGPVGEYRPLLERGTG